MNFYELYKNKLANEEDIHKYIDEWHSKGFGVKCELYEFLGLTKEQYYKWVDTNKLDII